MIGDGGDFVSFAGKYVMVNVVTDPEIAYPRSTTGV